MRDDRARGRHLNEKTLLVKLKDAGSGALLGSVLNVSSPNPKTTPSGALGTL